MNMTLNVGANTIISATPILSSGSANHLGIKFSNGTIIAVEVTSKSVIWSIETLDSTGMIFALDGDNDGVDEIFAMNKTTTTSELIVVDLTSGNIINRAETRLTQIDEVKEFNIDNDTYVDLLFVGQNSLGVMTTKTFEVIYEATYSVIINSVFVGDFDGDGLSDMVISLGNEAVVSLTNEYGSARVIIFTGNSKAYPVFADYDGDSISEVITLLGNSTILVTEIVSFSENYTTIAYETFSPLDSIPVFDNNKPLYRDGAIIAFDMNLDGNDEIIVSNGTAISVYELVSDELLFVKDTGTNVFGLTVTKYTSSGKYDILFHNTTHYFIMDLSGDIVAIVDPRISPIDTITKIASGDFDNDGVYEIFVSFKFSLVVYKGTKYKNVRSYQNPIIFITGDFDGNGIQEIAVKVLTTTDLPFNLEILRFDGVQFIQLYKTTISGTAANLYLPDILPLDIDSDGVDEVLFFNLTGEIDAFDANIGFKLKIITGIKNYALWVDNDQMFGSGGIAVKYAYEAFRVIEPSGAIKLEVLDSSSTKYQALDIDSDGFREYIGMTEGKLFGINQTGIKYYTKIGEQTSGFAISTFNGEVVIAVLTDNGYINLYKTTTTQVTSSGPTTQKNNDPLKVTLTSQLAIVAMPITIVTISLLAIVVMRRRDEKE